MKPKSFMLIAGEPSGDLLAAELVTALRRQLNGTAFEPTTDYQPLHTSLEPRFFGAGGRCMAAAGVELAFDMTSHSVIGLSDVFKNYLTFRRLFRRLFQLAWERQPDVIICVDFSGFNRRFAHAIKKHVGARNDWFHDWQPKLVQYVSPQVWASREGRAQGMSHDYELLLSIVPFEKAWYAKHAPELKVEFVGNPVVERYSGLVRVPAAPSTEGALQSREAQIALFPGSRPGELRRHVPVMLEVAHRIRAARSAKFRMVVPNEALAALAQTFKPDEHGIELSVGRISEVLQQIDLAITKSGTITLECAYFGVPAIVFYKTSSLTYQIGRRLVKVQNLAMPNLLADENIFPEFVQDTATPESITAAALEILQDPARNSKIKAQLAEVVKKLGAPGASERAARAILNLVRR